MKWIMTQVDRIRTWWNNHHTIIRHYVGQGARKFVRALKKLSNTFAKMILIGVIINVVGSYFYPDFPNRFPVIYEWFDGWLQLGEFTLKAALAAIHALFNGNWNQFCVEFSSAITELIQQFAEWIGTLHF